jgi:hypothetical protein
LEELGEQFEKIFMLNQHVAQVFEWSKEQRNYIRNQYTERRKIIEEMIPWPAADFAVDENWIRFHPYAQNVRGDQTITSLHIWNHSRQKETYSLKWNLPEWMDFMEEPVMELVLNPGEAGQIPLKIRNKMNRPTADRLQVITVDVKLEGDHSIGATTETMILLKE